MRKLALATFALALSVASAFAQVVGPGVIPVPGAGAYNASPPTCTNGQFCMLQTDVNGQLKISGSIAATIAGFTPGLTFASLTAAGTSGSVALPAGAVVAFQNTGTTTVSCTLGVGSATAVAGQVQVPASSTVFLTVGSNTFGACIDESGSVSNVVRLAGGTGLGTGFGGGGGGGGGGGAVTVADAADVTQGAIADAAVTAGATGTVNAHLRSISRDVMSVNTWASGTLGAMATYGTSPGAVNVPGVNAFVTNTLAPGQAAAASSSPVVLAKNSGTGSTVAGAAIGTAGTASAEVVTVQGIASMTPILSRPSDGTRNGIIDPCEATLQSYAPISITTATTTRIVAPSASNKTYICHLFLTSAAADNVGIVEGTGGTCGTATAGVIGGTTAANGPNFAANGGVALHAGGKVAVAQTAGTNVDLCLITSAATPLAGGIKYVQAP